MAGNSGGKMQADFSAGKAGGKTLREIKGENHLIVKFVTIKAARPRL